MQPKNNYVKKYMEEFHKPKTYRNRKKDIKNKQSLKELKEYRSYVS